MNYGWADPVNGKRIFCVEDNSELVGIDKFIEKDEIYIPTGEKNKKINLGIHMFNDKMYTSSLVGICRIHDRNHNIVFDDSGNELILKVVPRFGLNVISMLEYIKEDDEFDRYLAPQTTALDKEDEDVQLITQNELFFFFDSEYPLYVTDEILKETSIITVTAFLISLKQLCLKPLMQTMKEERENFVGNIKGKILVNENIRLNLSRGRNERMFCKYLKSTENIFENQMLKAALKKSKEYISNYLGISNKSNNYLSGIVSYCMNAFVNVEDITVRKRDYIDLKISGYYAYYKPVLRMARMVLEKTSIEISKGTNSNGYVVPYAISMEKLFEIFVRKYIKNNNVKSHKIDRNSGLGIEKFDKKYSVLKKKNVEDRTYIEGCIKPDIVLVDKKSNKVAVFDVKYKDYNKNSRNDRLQLLAYALLLDSEHIGFIFPSQNGKDIILDNNEIDIQHNTERMLKYYQIALDVNSSMNGKSKAIGKFLENILNK